jgi:hypothetical protein
MSSPIRQSVSMLMPDMLGRLFIFTSKLLIGFFGALVIVAGLVRGWFGGLDICNIMVSLTIAGIGVLLIWLATFFDSKSQPEIK